MPVSQLFEYAPHEVNAEGEWLSASVQYLVTDVLSEQAQLTAALSIIPKELKYTENKDSLMLDTVSIDERKAEKIWSITANYVQPEQSQIIIGGTGSSDSESTVSFDCGTGTKHITHAYAETRYPSSAPTADFAVNWNGKKGNDMQISGVDVPTAQLRETYTKSIPVSKLTTRYKRIVQNLVGRINNASFKGWERGEVQFLGMSYSAPTRNAKKVIVTYNFQIQPNESNVSVQGITISKKGFEYAYAVTDTVVNDGVSSVHTRAVYVDEVCKYGDFSQLGV